MRSLGSLGTDEKTGSSDPASSSVATSSDTDAVARLHEMFPQLQLSYLKTLVLLTEGDFVYAAAIAAECKEQISMNNNPNESFEPPTSPLNLGAKEKEKEGGKEETPPNDSESANALLINEKPQEPLAGSSADACQAETVPLIRLSPHFLKCTYEEYAPELGLPKLLLGQQEK